MADDGLTQVIMRNQFYRDKYRQVSLAFLLVLVINLLLAGIIFYKVINQPQPVYFATTADGKIVELEPLSTPVLSDAQVLQFATRAAVASYTYNYVNYREQLQGAADYFTVRGWKNYQEELKKSKNLEAVVNNRLVGYATPTGAPVIVDRGVIDGVYAWKVTLPILATYEGGATKITQPLTVTMVIIRVPVVSNPKGVEVSSFYAAERKIS